jgi:hypothetical protein
MMMMMTMKETQQERGRRALWHCARSHVGIAVGNTLPWSPGHVVSSNFMDFIVACAVYSTFRWLEKEAWIENHDSLGRGRTVLNSAILL